MLPLLSVVIPTFARSDLLVSAIDSLLDQSMDDIEVIVVDNASPTNISSMVHARFGKRVRSIRLASNLFYCGAANCGHSMSRGRFLAVVNDDCRVEPDWAEHVVETFERYPDIGSVATLVMREGNPGIVDSAGDHLDITGRAANLYWNRPVTEVPTTLTSVFSAAGSCAAYRRTAFEEAGGFDNDFIAYLDDVDLGFRLQLMGRMTMFNPLCRAHHIGGGTPKRRRSAIFLTERNMVWNIVKNMPEPVLYRHMLTIVLSNLRPAPIHGGGSVPAWIAGKRAALMGIRRCLRKRKLVQATRRVSANHIEALLTSRKVSSCHL